MTPPFEVTPLIAWGAAVVVGLGVLAAATVAIGRACMKALRFARTFDRFFREWFGEPEDLQRGEPRKPGIPERLGTVETHMGRMCERVSQVDAQVQNVVHEMHPNRGGSLRDAVDRIERSSAPTSAHQTIITPTGDQNQEE
jgi:uncharacterized protein with von Willebrand factor type A (vWA) domain